MNTSYDHPPPDLRSVAGVLIVVVFGIAFAVAGLGFAAYLVLRDADLGLDFDVGPSIDELEWSPSAEWVGGFDAATGEPRWARRFRAGAEPVGMHGSRLVVLEPGGFVAMDAPTGTEVWRRPVDARVEHVGLTGDAVVFADAQGTLVALEAATGSERWRIPNGAFFAKELVTGGDLAVVVTGAGEVRGVDAGTGALRWVMPLDTSSVVTGSIVGDIAVVRTATAAVAFDVTAGAVRWTWTVPVDQSGLSAFSGYLDPPIGAGPVVGLQIFDVPVGRPTTSTVFVDAATGAERWRTPSGALSSFGYDPLVAGGTLFENGDAGRLRARDPLSGAVWFEVRMRSGRVFAAPAGVFVADDAVIAVDAGTGARRWVRNLRETGAAAPVATVDGLVVVAGEAVPED